MTHSNLILTEKAIKKHCKRLHKEILEHTDFFSLGQTQNLFARTLGFKNFHELQEILENRIFSSFTIEEKFIFVIFSLIIDNQKDFAFKVLKEYHHQEFNQNIIDLLFEKYQRRSCITANIKKHKTKETIFIKLLELVREKQSFAPAYLIFLRTINLDLWNIINSCARTLTSIENPYVIKTFNTYSLENR